MRRLTTAVVAFAMLFTVNQGMATVRMDSGGLGEGLLFPFYTTLNGQTTLLNIQNHSPDAKALKLRVLETLQGSEALTLNIYLGAHARWSAALTLPQDGNTLPAALLGNGKGCTVPQLTQAIPLSPSRIDDPNIDFWGEFTRRGYVEVVEMGTLEPALAQMAADATSADCDALETRLLEGAWVQNPNAGLRAPSGALRGDAVILDTADGTSFGYQALAFNGLSDGPRQFALNGHVADPLSPRLDDIEPDGAGEIRVEVAVRGEAPVTFRYPAGRGHDAISALLASSHVAGNYNVDGSTDAASEWVLSFPTRSAYRSGPQEPFDQGQACASYVLDVFGDDGSPDPGATDRSFVACDSVSTFKFFPSTDENSGPAHPIFYHYGTGGSIIPILPDNGARDLAESIGSASIDFLQSHVLEDDVVAARKSAPDLDGKCWIGLPVWALQVQTLSNANARPGRIASFPDARVATRSFKAIDCGTDG